jgi:hypothetical protein
MKWVKAVAVVSVLLIAVAFISLKRSHRKETPRSSMRVLETTDVASHPALLHAYKKYQQRGGRYIWGTNDCSVFVSDYLIKRSPKFKWRLTTASMDSIYVNQYRLYDAGIPTSGDILNYRYRSNRTDRQAGHCGVIVQKPTGTFVIHNCATRGLVIEAYKDFMRTAVLLGVNRLDIRTLRLK